MIRIRYIAAAAVILAALAANFPTLSSPFFLDDYLLFERSQQLDISSLAHGWELKSSDLEAFWWVPDGVSVKYFRPLITLSFALDRSLWGRDPVGFHLTNLLVHFLGSLLVYRIGIRLLREPRLAALGSILFLLHPIHAGAVQWISGRIDVIMTFFYLLAFLSYLEMKAETAVRWWQPLLCIVAFVLSLLSKESAITLPLLILLTDWLFADSLPPPRERSRWIPRTRFSIFVIAGLYLLSRIPELLQGWPPSPYALPLQASGLADILLQLVLYAISSLFLIPILPLHNLEAWKAQPLPFVLAALFLLLATIAVWRKTPRPRLVLYFAGWFLLTLLPSSFIMMGQRLAYLPSAGFCLLLAVVIGDLDSRLAGGRRVIRLAGSVLVLGIFAVITALQGMILRSVSDESFRMTGRIVQTAESGEGSRRVFVVNGWMLNSLWISSASRWMASGRVPEVTVLTLSPDLFPPSLYQRFPFIFKSVQWLAGSVTPVPPPDVKLVDSCTVRVQSHGEGLFDSPRLQFFLFGRAESNGEQVIHSRQVIAHVRPEGSEPARTITFFPAPQRGRAESLFLMQDNLRIDSLFVTVCATNLPHP